MINKNHNKDQINKINYGDKKEIMNTEDNSVRAETEKKHVSVR